MSWRWLFLGGVGGRFVYVVGFYWWGMHKFDAMIEPLLAITLVAQYVLLAFVFCREDMWVHISHLLIASIPLVLYWSTYCCPAGGRLLLSVARGGEVISADAELPDAVVHIRRREEAENRGCLSSPCLSLCFRCVCATVYRAPCRCVERFGLICLNKTM